jgi:hypothetical protein
MPRRIFLELAGVAGIAVGVLGVGAASADAAPSISADQRDDMILRIAKAGAVFPVPFGDFGETGPAIDRATLRRLGQARARLPVARATLAQSGADALISQGLTTVDQPNLLTGLGRMAVTAGPADRRGLSAATALAIGTVSTHFDPKSDDAAQLWLGGLGRLYQRGDLPSVAEGRTS